MSISFYLNLRNLLYLILQLPAKHHFFKKILKKCLTDRAAEGNNKIRPEGHKPSGRTKK